MTDKAHADLPLPEWLFDRLKAPTRVPRPPRWCGATGPWRCWHSPGPRTPRPARRPEPAGQPGDRFAAEVDTARRTGARLAGPIPLPTEKNKWTVLRSPHVDKKSREQFEMRTHKRLIDIFEPTPQTVDALMKLDLAAGVDVGLVLQQGFRHRLVPVGGRVVERRLAGVVLVVDLRPRLQQQVHHHPVELAVRAPPAPHVVAPERPHRPRQHARHPEDPVTAKRVRLTLEDAQRPRLALDDGKTAPQHREIAAPAVAAGAPHRAVGGAAGGTTAARRYDVTTVAQPVVRRLAQATGESAFFSARRGDETVCLLREDGSFPIRSHVLYEGIRFPLGVATAGLVILAYLGDREIDSYLASADLVASYGEPHAAAAVRQRIRTTRKQGYALNPGLIVEGSWGMGAAVFDAEDRPRWALTLTGIEQRFGKERRAELGGLLLRAAHELTNELR